MLTIDILICTIDKGILDVPNILLPKAEGINYIVSMQYTNDIFLSMVPHELFRDDVSISYVNGGGLSINRNNSIKHSEGDICIIADDDVRYSMDSLLKLRKLYDDNSEIDVLLFKASYVDGSPLKKYPKEETALKKMPRGYYPSSIEISFRRRAVGNIMFDERFGLGSKYTVCGEEEVFVHKLIKNGLFVKFVPFTLVQTTERPKSAVGFSDKKELQFTKGAVLYYIYGWTSWLRCLKCAFCNMFANKVCFLSMYKEMVRGILYIMRTGR